MGDLDPTPRPCSWCWWYESPPDSFGRHGVCMRKTDRFHIHWVHELHPECNRYTEEKPAGLTDPRSDKPWRGKEHR